MSKVEDAAKAFVGTLLVVTGLALGLTALGVGSGIATASVMGTTLFGVSAMTLATASGLTTLLAGLYTQSFDNISNNFGTRTTTRSPTAPRQIIYGVTRVGGTILHMQTTGTDNYLLHMVVAIAGHEITGINSVRIGETNVTTTTSTINGETVYTVTNSKYTNTENENNFGSGRLIRYTIEDGSQTTANGFLDAQLSSMTSNHKFQGIAYVYIQMVADSEKFSSIPAISFVVEGKNVYDPRTSAMATTTAQRQNPALIIRDYLTDTTYGLKATSDEINDTTNAGGFSACANLCDQTISDEANGARYTVNGFIDASTNGSDAITGFLSAMAGKMTYVNGKFNVFGGASQTPSLTITDDDLLAKVRVTTGSPSGNLANTIKAVYVDSNNNYTAIDSPVYQDSTFLGEDTPSGESNANYVKETEVQLPFTTTSKMAQRLARINLKSQRQAQTLEVMTSLQFMRLQPSDWVYLTNERLSYSSKVFEVVATNLEVINTEGGQPILATKLALKETDSGVFDFVTNDYTDDQSEGSVIDSGDGSITTPTSLSLAQSIEKDGQELRVNVIASWTNNTNAIIVGTEVAYKLSTDTNFSGVTVGRGTANATIPNLAIGKTYNVKVRHISSTGAVSSYTSVVNITISSLTDAPSDPSNFAVSSETALGFTLSWTNPNNADLSYIEVHRRTVNTTPTDTSTIVTIRGAVANTNLYVSQTVRNGLTIGTTYYYWIRAVNTSGVKSNFVGSVNGTITRLEDDKIGDVGATKITGTLIDSQIDGIGANKITGTLADSQLDAISATKITGTIVDSQLDAISATKVSGTLADSQLDAISASKVTGTLADNQLAGISATKITGTLVDSQLDEISASKVTGTLADSQLAGISATKVTGTLADSQLAGISATKVTGTLADSQLAGISASKVTGQLADTQLAEISADKVTGSVGDLDATLIKLDGTQLSASSSGIRVSNNSLDIAQVATTNSIGVILADEGSHTMSNTATSGGSTSFHIPERVSTPLTLTIPQTATAESKDFLIRMFVNPIGSAVSNTAINVQVGYATASNITSFNASPFYSGGSIDTTFASSYANGAFAEALGIAHKFSITTSTSGSTTVYIYGFAGLFGISSPGVSYVLSCEGLFR